MSESAGTPLEPTKEMVEAGAQRLVRWETGKETWPDSWSALDVRASRNDAEKVWRSMWLAAPSPAGPDALAEERPDRLTQQQTIDMLADEIESGARKWETANGDIQIRFYSRFEVVSLIAALRSRPAQDRDAERYRWLRGPNLIVSLQFAWPEVTVPQNVGQGIEAACDAAIDAAMSQQEPK